MSITKYKVRIFFSKTKKLFNEFYVDSIRLKPKKRRVIGSVLVLFLIIFGSIYGLSLRGKAADPTNPNTYNVSYDGVSIHTKAENITANSERINTATIINGEKMKFTLTVSNPSTKDREKTKVRFTLPTGFKYVPGSASISPFPYPYSFNSTPNEANGGVLEWNEFTAISGESLITFEAELPGGGTTTP